MSQIRPPSNASAKVSGVIATPLAHSHEKYGEGFYEFNLAVRRLSSVEDIIPITLSERLIAPGMLESGNFDVGKPLALEGTLRSYNKLVSGKSKLMLSLFVSEFCHETPLQDINELNVSGFICKSPIYRKTPFNREICDILVAVNRAYNKSDYIPCIAWGRNAQYVKTLPVGVPIQFKGRIQSREYLKKYTESGEDIVIPKIAFEVSISTIHIVNEEAQQANAEVSSYEE